MQKNAGTRQREALGNARQRNRDAGAAVLIEGRRDRQALERLGFTGPIEVLNRGWPVDDVLVRMVETYGRQRDADGQASIIVLMDWDRTQGTAPSAVPKKFTIVGYQIR